MSDRVRLRLAGELLAVALPVAPEPRPIACVAVVGAHAGVDVEPMASAIAAAGAARWRAIVRAREGAEAVDKDGEVIVRASPEAMDAALEALRTGHPAVAVGAAFVALRRPILAILITGGATPVQWDPDVRRLRERFDLVLEEPRPALARELRERIFKRA